MPLYGYGSNSYGQLGIGNAEDKQKRKQISLPKEFEHPPTRILGGGNHTIIYDNNKYAYVTGSNQYGQIGGSEDKYLLFTRMQLLDGLQFVALGLNHTMFLKGDEVHLLGENNCCQLGIQDKAIKQNQIKINQEIRKLVCGPRNSFILFKNGTIIAAGCNKFGQLSQCKDIKFITNFIQLPVVNIIDVSAGFHHTLLLDEEFNLFGLGRNNSFQLGLNELKFTYEPKLILNHVKQIYSGWYHNLIINNENNLITFGTNKLGELGNKDNIQFFNINLNEVNEINLGSHHNLYLLNNGDLYTNGWNEHYNCKLEDQNYIYNPTLIESKVIQFGNGYAYTIIYKQ